LLIVSITVVKCNSVIIIIVIKFIRRIPVTQYVNRLQNRFPISKVKSS